MGFFCSWSEWFQSIFAPPSGFTVGLHPTGPRLSYRGGSIPDVDTNQQEALFELPAHALRAIKVP